MQQISPVDAEVPSFVANGAAVESELLLEETEMHLVDQNLPADRIQPSENLLTRHLLDLIPAKVQPENLLDELFNQHGKRDRSATFGFVFSNPLSRHLLDDFVP